MTEPPAPPAGMTPSGPVTARATLVRADNSGPMTLTGTNTWILREPGATRSVVVDPGPLVGDHLDALRQAAGDVALILFTHRHYDHTEALGEFVELTGAPARAIDPAFCTTGAEPLSDGETIDVDGLHIVVHHTAGHTADSACFRLPAERSLLSGDTILGTGTTVVAHPDGILSAYLDSLAELRELIDEQLVERMLPGHGPVVDDPMSTVDFYIDHRYARLEQVRDALSRGAQTAQDVVEMVYGDVHPALWPAAELSVEAQLVYLRG